MSLNQPAPVIPASLTPELKFITRVVKNPYKWLFAIDYGNDYGPWLAFVFNKKLYGFGYLPTKKKSKKKSNVITLSGKTETKEVAVLQTQDA